MPVSTCNFMTTESTPHYPKVLIIGLSVETLSGSGITLTNLFKTWDSDKLAVATENVVIADSISKKNYQLGYLENKRKFPFHFIQKKQQSGLINLDATKGGPVASAKTDSAFKKLYNGFLYFTGLYNYSRNLCISPAFKAWVLDFKPEYIYTTANELEVIRFTKEVQILTGAKIITHIWDDLITNYYNKPGLLYKYWERQINKEFKGLLYHSFLRLSISSAMGDEYYNRYGYHFKTFHNCLELSQNLAVARVDYTAKKPFVFLYAGRVGLGITDCLDDFCQAILKLKNPDLEFHIQTTSKHEILEKLKKYPFVILRPVVDYDQIPGILSGADVLLLPYNFDKESVRVLQLSMPTKAPEYMVSGTPVLLYASGEMFFTRYVKEHQLGYAVTQNTSEAIINGINALYNSVQLRKELGERAKDFAVSNFDCSKVRADFLQLLAGGLHDE